MPDATADSPPEEPARAVPDPRRDLSFPRRWLGEGERLRHFGGERCFRDLASPDIRRLRFTFGGAAFRVGLTASDVAA